MPTANLKLPTALGPVPKATMPLCLNYDLPDEKIKELRIKFFNAENLFPGSNSFLKMNG